MNMPAQIAQNTPPALLMDEQELMNVLRNSLYPGASDPSIKLVMSYCKASGLDPMTKPVHIVPMWDSKSDAMRDAIMPGIGKYRTDAARSGEYIGISEPEFGPEITETLPAEKGWLNKKEHLFPERTITYPAWCKITVRRLVGGHIAEFTAIERWKENYATAGRRRAHPNEMWDRRPYGQIAKCTEAQALRKAFPEFGAAPTADEMEGKELYVGGHTIDAGTGDVTTPPAATVRTPQRRSEQAADNVVDMPPPQPSANAAPPGDNAPASPGCLSMIRRLADKKGLTEANVCAQFGLSVLDGISVDLGNQILGWVRNHGA